VAGQVEGPRGRTSQPSGGFRGRAPRPADGLREALFPRGPWRLCAAGRHRVIPPRQRSRTRCWPSRCATSWCAGRVTAAR